MLPTLPLHTYVKIASKLPKKTLAKTGDLRCMYSGFVFGQKIVDEYNNYMQVYHSAGTAKEKNDAIRKRNAFLEGTMMGSLKREQRIRGIH